MKPLQRLVWTSLTIVGLLLCGGCTTTSMVMGAMGVATDTSIPWAIAKHIHGKLTEGDPPHCWQLNSVQRATATRCGEFVRGSLKTEDIASSGLQECPLILAAQDSRLWPVLPELLEKGALPESCWQSPLLTLAQQQACPDFSKASPQVLRSMEWLAVADSRAVHHDVMRMLSCPSARMAGLNAVLDTWQAAGALRPEVVGFSPLSALHPDHLVSPFGLELEAAGHKVPAAFAMGQGKLAPGFEEALRTNNKPALEWWLARAPQLANSVPPAQANQIRWVPLARVLIPSFMEHPQDQQAVIEFLLARGADPWNRLPFDSGKSVVSYAQSLKSPFVALLDRPQVDRSTRPAMVAASTRPGTTGDAKAGATGTE